MEPKPLMNKWKAAMLMGTSGMFDAAQVGVTLALVAFLPPLGTILAPIVAFLIGIVGIVTLLGVCQGFGLKFMKGKRGLIKMIGIAGGIAIEAIPFIDDVPGLTLSAATIVYNTQKEDEMAKKEYAAQGNTSVTVEVQATAQAANQQRIVQQILVQRRQQEQQAVLENEQAQEELQVAKEEEERKKRERIADITALGADTEIKRNEQEMLAATDNAEPFRSAG